MPTTLSPERLADIHRARLAANEARLRRATVRSEVALEPTYASGLRRCARIIRGVAEDDRHPARGLTIERLLTAVRGVRRDRVGHLMRRMRPTVSQTVRLEHLSAKRAEQLAEVLEAVADQAPDRDGGTVAA